MIGLAVGEPYPFPTVHGMRVVLEPGDDAPNVTLVIVIGKPSAAERAALTKEPLRFGLLAAPPLVWVLLAGTSLSFDAPYGIGLEPRREAIYASVALAPRWTESARQLVQIHAVDESTGHLFGLRAVTVSRDWMRCLSGALTADQIDRSAYQRAIDRDYARWPSTDAMLRAATIVEIGGRV